MTHFEHSVLVGLTCWVERGCLDPVALGFVPCPLCGTVHPPFLPVTITVVLWPYGKRAHVAGGPCAHCDGWHE